MSTETTSETGIAHRAMSVSRGLTVSIMTSTPTSWSTALRICESVCWSVCWMLSMSFVMRLSSSPRGWASK